MGMSLFQALRIGFDVKAFRKSIRTDISTRRQQ